MSSHLENILKTEIQRRNVNACAGLLRRLASEDSDASATLRRLSAVGAAIDLGVDAIRTQQAAASPPIVSASLAVLANISAAVDRWKDALIFVDTSRKGTHCTPSPVFLAKLMNKDNAFPVAQWCDARTLRFCVPTAIARLGVLGGAWDTALRLALKYESHGERYSTGVLIPLLAHGGQPDEAVKTFRTAVAEGHMLDLTLIENIVRATVAAGHWKAATTILKDLDKFTVTHELATSPTMADTYQQTLTACTDWRTTLELLEIIKRSSLKPLTEKMIAAALDTADKCGQIEMSAHLYDYAREQGIVKDLPEASKELLVRSFRAAAQWDKALEALQWMSKANEATVREGLITTIDLCAESGQWQLALAAAEEVLSGATDTIPPQTALSILNACAKGKRCDLAEQYFERFCDDPTMNLPPTALCVLMQTCLDNGKPAAALKAFRLAEKLSPSILIPPAAQRLAVVAAAGSGNWEESLLLVNAMNKEGLPHDAQIQRYGLWAAALTGSWRTSLAMYAKISPQLVTRKDRELVRISAHKAGPVAQAIVKQLAMSVGTPKRK